LSKEVDKIKVTCWYCGKKFEIEKANIKAGELFCSDDCRNENLRLERSMKEIDEVMRDR